MTVDEQLHRAPEVILGRPGLRARLASLLADDPAVAIPARPEIAAPESPVLRPVIVAVVVAGVLVRFLPAGPLWFDEAQSVGIARLPVLQLFAALRQDGSPPLYYLLLHGWMLVFGRSAFAVRSMSGLFSVATIPVGALLARRVLPERARGPAVLLLAASPFAIRFADEARMYSLVMLLVAAGGVLLCRALESPRRARLAALAAASGLLALTHYWALFLLAVVGAGLAWRAFRAAGSPGALAARRCLLGLLAGGILFLPWLPSMLFQVANTGTPWQHPGPLDSTVALAAWAGAMGVVPAMVPAVPLVGLLFLFVAGGSARSAGARRLAVVAVVTIALAGGASVILGAAIVPRYTAVGLVPYVMAAGAGVALLVQPWARRMLAVAVALGLVAGVLDATAPRTLAGTAAGILKTHGLPGDTVVYCPDQLGPDVSRLLPGWYQQEMYPTGAFPDRVDWIGYARRNYESSPEVFAEGVTAQASNQPVWLLEASNFTSYYGRCQQLAGALLRLRPHTVVYSLGPDPVNTTQREALVEYLPGGV